MFHRIIVAVLAVVMTAAPIAARADAPPASLQGRILDTSQGLPVPAAHVELDAGGKIVAQTDTDAGGTFSFSTVAPGEYSLLIVARGFVTTSIPSVVLLAGETTLLQTAVQPSASASGSLKQIGHVVVAGRAALQTSSTINRYIDAAEVQNFGYTRVGDVLANLPGVTAYTSSSVGDDLSLSIRGFNQSETATLLDGHPIGPIGAQGAGFNFKISPFWGTSGTSVIYGSGAAGLYGTSTVAGAVDFQTLNPTRDPQASVQQGVGGYDHLLSGFTATGSLGKFGYALAGASQGTTGQFPGSVITQTGLLGSSALYSSPTVGGKPAPHGYAPPDLTAANVNNIANSYFVSGAYTQKNGLAKFTYAPSSATQVLVTAFDAATWNDKTGEGDNDFLSYDYQLYHAPTGNNFTLPNGGTTTCSTAQVAVLNDSSAGFACMTPQQYAQTFSGPFGGGIGRFNASHLQDYHGRVTEQLGKSTVVIDGFVDNFFSDEHKSPTGPWFNDTYRTHGFLISDEFMAGRQNDVSFGYYTQHQDHHSTTIFDQQPITDNGTFGLTSNSFFLRDTYTPNLKFTTFADLWYQHSVATSTNNFDPRLSFVYRPSARDIVRLTGGRAYSEPDPFTVLATNAQTGAPQSLNPVCSAGALNSVGNIANPDLKTETATDEEVSYGHRFSPVTVVQIDAYNSNEQNAILNGNLPISQFPQYNAVLQQPYTEANGNTVTLEQGFLDRIAGQCGGTPSPAVLGWTLNVNAGQARYRGIDVNAQIGVVPNLQLQADYGIQSAQYSGIPITVLQNNTTIINDTQITSVPLRKGTASLVYSNLAGTRAQLQANYVGTNNPFNRGAYWYANAAVSKTTGPVTVSLGVENLFNSVAQQYGYIGLGVFRPENQFGGDMNALDQGTEEFGLPYRQAFLTVNFRI